MPAWLLIFGLVGIFAGVAIAILTFEAIGRERSQISGSMAAIEAISGPPPEDMRRELDQPFNVRVTGPIREWLIRIGRRLTGSDWTANAARRLERAGSPIGWYPDRLLAAKVGLAIALGLTTAALLLISGRSWQAILWGGVAALLGFFVPDLILRSRSQARSEQIRRSLPDSIDLLLISVESGLAFDASLSQVAHNTDGPLAQEFTRVLKEVQIGSSRSAALRGLAERTDVDDLRIFLNTMVQAEKLGLPIADVLRTQSSEIRMKRSQRVEERAMKLPVKLVFPVMFGIMPALFIVILGPAVLGIIDTLG